MVIFLCVVPRCAFWCYPYSTLVNLALDTRKRDKDQNNVKVILDFPKCTSLLFNLEHVIPSHGLMVSDTLKMDMPILTCIFFTFSRLTLTSEMHFVNFHPEVAFCEFSPWGSFLFTLHRQKKVCTPGDEAIMKYIRNYFLVYHLISHFLLYLQN